MSNNLTKLTKKQQKFYESLKRLIDRNKQSPTISELVRLMKFSSPHAVTQYLNSLEKKGLIERQRYEARGIKLKETIHNTTNIPVIASAGCDNVSIFAQRNFGEYICIATELLQGIDKERVVCIRAVGDSMIDAGIKEGDYVLVEVTEAISENDLVVAIIDSFAVIKKIELANNAVILRPVSSNPKHKPIILNRYFRIFGKVMDVIRVKPTQGELEIVPLY